MGNTRDQVQAGAHFLQKNPLPRAVFGVISTDLGISVYVARTMSPIRQCVKQASPESRLVWDLSLAKNPSRL